VGENRWNALVGEGYGKSDAARFADLAASGKDVHGEARFCHTRLAAGSRVLDAGCGTGRVAIWLAEQGHAVTGADVDASMLDEARRRAPGLDWVQCDLAAIGRAGLERGFDMVVAAGNVIPLLAEGTEAEVVAGLAALLRPGGLMMAGFGLDAAHLPLSSAPVTLADYDTWCAEAGLDLQERFATWDGDAYDGRGYAVSVHARRPAS
jgi:SAM-dependent methyltransferase